MLDRHFLAALQVFRLLVYIHFNGKEDWLLELNVTKNTDYVKKTLNKSSWKLNFLQKTQWAQMSISPGVWRERSKDCRDRNIVKYGNRKIGWFYGSTLPKIPIIWKKALNKSFWKLNSPKKLSGRTCLSPLEWRYMVPKIAIFEIL